MEINKSRKEQNKNANQYQYSVVIPLYCSVGYLADIFKKIQQYNKSIEWILVEDGSPDDTRHWLNTYINQIGEYSVKTILLDKNYGQHAATWQGIIKATGKYIITLDDDSLKYLGNAIDLANSLDEQNNLSYIKLHNLHSDVIRKWGNQLVTLLFRIFTSASHGVSSLRIIKGAYIQKLPCCYRTSYLDIGLVQKSGKIQYTYLPSLHTEIQLTRYSLKSLVHLFCRLLFSFLYLTYSRS